MKIARLFTYLELMGLFERASSECSLGTQFIREFYIILHQKKNLINGLLSLVATAKQDFFVEFEEGSF